DDRRNWREGIQHLAETGCNGLLLPPSRPLRELLMQAGLQRVAGGVYNPPGYAFEFGVPPRAPATTPAAIEAWAKSRAKPYLDAGYPPQQMAIFAMADEPAGTTRRR